MRKYIKSLINGMIKVGCVLVGVLFSANITVAGFLFFPDVMTKVDRLLGDNPSGFAYIVIPGTLPLCYVLAFISFAVYLLFLAIKISKTIDIQYILDDMKLKPK